MTVFSENDPAKFVASADFSSIEVPGSGPLEGLEDTGLDIDKLPDGVVSGTTLIDFSKVQSPKVRSGVSLAMLFASKLAHVQAGVDDGPDEWLARYTSNLSELGFRMSGMGIVNSSFKKTGVNVHKAIIPFLTVAFGGAAVGPIILEGLKQLQETDKEKPWITLFDKETERFEAHEMHFAAVSSDEMETSVRYAVARLNVETNDTQILFFRINNDNIAFESSTTTMAANNSFLALLKPEMEAKLGTLTKAFIKEADFSVLGA